MGDAPLGRLAGGFVGRRAGGAGAAWTLGALGLVGEPINLLNSILPTLVWPAGLPMRCIWSMTFGGHDARGSDSGSRRCR